MKLKNREKILAKVIVDEWLHNHPSTKLECSSVIDIDFKQNDGFMTITIKWIDTKGNTHNWVWNRWNNEI